MTNLGFSKSQRRRKLGIECADRLVWKSWEPGEEHLRKLVIKNVESRAQVITFTLPEHRTTFLTPFPEPVTLSSGMSYELAVRFCPTELVEIHDCIEVQVKGRGTFTVALDCLTPFARLHCSPQTHDFGFCPVRATTATDEGNAVRMTNSGTVPIDYAWEVPAPFAVSPAHGHLEQGETQLLRLSFCPTEACAVLGQAVCKMMEIDEIISTMQLSGVGKYPFVRLQAPVDPLLQQHSSGGSLSTAASGRRGKAGTGAAAVTTARAPVFGATMAQQNAVTALVDFATVPAGYVASHEFVVENPSPVPAQVALHCCSLPQGDVGANGMDTLSTTALASGATDPTSAAFRVQPAVATIPPGGRQTYKMTFRAKGTGSLNQAAYELRSTAGNTIRLSVKGSVTGPRLKVSASYLDYGDVDLDRVLLSDHTSAALAVKEAQQRLVRHVSISNPTSSAVPCRFQFLCTTPGAAFRVEPAAGTVASGQSLRVKVTFQPTEPVQYLRRLLILIEDSAEALFLDVFGVAYDAGARPPPFGLAEVDAFFARLDAGLAFYTPAELESAVARAEAGELSWVGLGPDPLTGATARKGTGRLSYAAAAEQLAMPLAQGGGGGRRCSGGGVAAAAAAGPFSLDSKVVTFSRGVAAGTGASSASSGAGGTAMQHVTVCNASQEPAVATWAVPVNSPFTVVPAQLEVPACGTAQFQLLLRVPSRDGGTSYDKGNADFSSSLSNQTQFLECYVNYQQMSSFRYVNSGAAVTPPHCLVLQCRRDGAPSATPQPTRLGGGSGAGALVNRKRAAAAEMHVSASNSFVRFPPCYVGSASYQVLSLVNSGDVAFMFELKGFMIREVSEKVHSDITVLGDEAGESGSFITSIGGEEGEASPTSTLMASRQAGLGLRTTANGGGVDMGVTFTCYPHTGLLPPHQHTLLLLRFQPACHARYEAEVQLQVYSGGGGGHGETITVALHGETYVPQLQLLTSPMEAHGSSNADAVVAFPLTCVTGEARLPLWLFNPTGLPVEYQLTPSPDLLGVVRFEPSAGMLEPSGRQPITACFAPEMARRYDGSAVLLLRGAENDSGAGEAPAPAAEYLMLWPMSGEGLHGMVEVAPAVLDCGEVAGLEPQTVSLTLYNSGLCEVGYEVRSLTSAEPHEWRHATQPPSLRNSTGTIPARTHKVVLATVYPAAAGVSEYLLYAMIAGLGTNIAAVPGPRSVAEAEQHPHCRLTIRGKRPAVQVADVRSLTQLRSQLWRQLSITALNTQLAAPVQPKDVRADTYAFHQFVEGLTPITMELAIGPQHGVAAVFTVLLENAGNCAADFSLWMPTESSVTEENWFLEDGALKDIQAILDKRIIEVSPRSGSIPAGGTAVLTLVYRFAEVGIHTLPVVLRVADGRRALLVLEGRTVPEGISCLTTHAASAEYELMPVALGDVEPPMQYVMVLDNPLDTPVAYAVDQQALRQLAEANYGFPILQCVNPTGVLPPRSMTELCWYFRPLEAKEYSMSVPVLTSSSSGGVGKSAMAAMESGAGGESYTFTFVGRGFHPRRTSPAEVRALTARAFLPIPPTPSAAAAVRLLHAGSGLAPSLPVTLSPEVLSLGVVPYFALRRSCCTLVNTHPTDTYVFEWDCEHLLGDHMLTIRPARGTLPPNGGRVDCRMSLYTGSTSQLLQWSVPCRLTNRTAVAQALASESGSDLASEATARSAESEYFAVDGTGLQQMREDSKVVFERRTCTKAALMRLRKLQQARSGTQRLPVTDIPPESLGIGALSRQVLAGRRELTEGAGGTVASAAADQSETVVSAVVELLVQARIMPVDEYERVYGQGSLRGTYQPLVAVFRDPMAPVLDRARTGGSSGSSAPTVDEARVAGEVLEELVRSVVAQPAVRAAFTEPHDAKVLYYQDMKQQETQQQQQEDAQHGKERALTANTNGGSNVLAGLVGNVLEEALEELIFQAVVSGVADCA